MHGCDGWRCHLQPLHLQTGATTWRVSGRPASNFSWITEKLAGFLNRQVIVTFTVVVGAVCMCTTLSNNKLHCKNIRISADVLRRVFLSLTEPVPRTFVSVNRRNNATLQCGAVLQCAVRCRSAPRRSAPRRTALRRNATHQHHTRCDRKWYSDVAACVFVPKLCISVFL